MIQITASERVSRGDRHVHAQAREHIGHDVAAQQQAEVRGAGLVVAKAVMPPRRWHAVQICLGHVRIDVCARSSVHITSHTHLASTTHSTERTTCVDTSGQPAAPRPRIGIGFDANGHHLGFHFLCEECKFKTVPHVRHHHHLGCRRDLLPQ